MQDQEKTNLVIEFLLSVTISLGDIYTVKIQEQFSVFVTVAGFVEGNSDE